MLPILLNLAIEGFLHNKMKVLIILKKKNKNPVNYGVTLALICVSENCESSDQF